MKRITLLPIIVYFCLLCTTSSNVYARIDKASMSTYSMSFTENKGQITDQFGQTRKDIDFMLHQKGISVFIGDGSFHYQWSKTKNNAEPNTDKPKFGGKGTITEFYRIDVELVGANKHAEVVREEMQPAYKRYYLPSTEPGVIAHTYNKVIYKNIYPGIDWVLYTSESKTLKYDFVVHPGADPTQIKLRYLGATSLKLKNDALQISTPFGNLDEGAPYSYISKGEKISSAYRVENNTVSFDLGSYTQAGQDLVIDPTIAWSTYFGQIEDEFGYSVATDSNGNVYLAGTTNSTALIATSGAHQTTFGSPNKSTTDGYLALFDGTGSLQWATYYGGGGEDVIFYLATDTLDHVYAAGITASSSGISSSSSVQQPNFGGGSSDAFLVKFDKNGARVWGTYFGGGNDEVISSFTDYMVGVAWDRFTNKVYLCGTTLSTSGIATSGAHQSSKGTAEDAYLAQFTAGGALQWATYFGGNSLDKAVKVACDRYGYVYITGVTYSSNNIASSSSVHQPLIGTSSPDAFLAKFSSAGKQVWSTYYGGNDVDNAAGIVTDQDANVYIAGNTTSTNNIATPNSFQPSLAATSADAFLVKFDSSGSRKWGTYFGGGSSEQTSDLAIDGTGNICFAGTTASSGLGTSGAYQPNFHPNTLNPGYTDAYLAIFGPAGNRSYVTYIGDIGVDNGFGLSYSRSGDLFMSGCTNSSSGISYGGAAQPSLSGTGTQDAYLAKFKADTAAYIVTPFAPLLYCQGDSIIVPYGTTNPFMTSNTFTLQLSDASGSFGSPTNLAALSSATAGTLRAKIPSSITAGTGYRIRIVSTNPARISFDNGSNISIQTRPAAPTFSSNSPICSGNTLNFTANTTTTGSIAYAWTGPNSFSANTKTASVSNAATTASGYYVAKLTLNGCWVKDSVLLTVNRTPDLPQVSNNSPVCTGDTIKLFSTSGPTGVTYSWTGPQSFISSKKDTIRIADTTAFDGYYVVTAKLGNCTSIDSTKVDVTQSVSPMVQIIPDPSATICVNDTVKFTANTLNGGSAPTYQWFINGIAINGANSLGFIDSTALDGDEVMFVLTSNEVCLKKPTDTARVKLTVVPPVPPEVKLTSNATTGPSGFVFEFKATPKYGGPTPTFKWFILRKGASGPQLISGVNSDKLNRIMGTIEIDSGDCIWCEVTSSLKCTNPKTAISDTICITEFLGVSNIRALDDLQLFPNPNNGKFTIKGKLNAVLPVDIQLINAVGQLIYQSNLSPKAELNEQINVKNASGVYMLRIKAGDEVLMRRIVIKNE